MIISFYIQVVIIANKNPLVSHILSQWHLCSRINCQEMKYLKQAVNFLNVLNANLSLIDTEFTETKFNFDDSQKLHPFCFCSNTFQTLLNVGGFFLNLYCARLRIDLNNSC